jgi:reticulon-4-interacting protein 1, mitochondrial
MSSSSSPVKAWIYTSAGYPKTLTHSNTTVPSSPAPHYLLIRTHAAALNPADIQLMNSPIWSLPYLSHPKVPCADFSGTVLAAGEGTSFQKDDEVFGFHLTPGQGGTLAEVLHIKEGGPSGAGATIVKKPNDWTHAQAASLPLVWLTARTCIELCEPYVKKDMGKIVVLGGSSGVGMYVVYLAKERGWEVLASCSGRNGEFVKTMGASQIVDYTSENVVERVRSFRPDAIVDCVGGTDCLGITNRYVTIVGDKTNRASMGGSLIYAFNPRMVLRWFWGWMSWGEKYDCISLDPRKEYLEEALQLPKEKIIIDSTFAFDDVKAAFERLNTGRARGKVVVEI